MPTSKRRRRRRGPVDYAGQPKRRWPFPLNVIFNVKAFYFVFIVVMMASMAAVGFTGASSSNAPKLTPIDRTATPVISAAPVNFASPAPVIDASDPYIATLKTNKGDITIELATNAPQAVNSFAFLAAKHFYDGTAFFFIDHKYWAQVGDPDCRLDATTTCTGTNDAGYKLPVENSNAKHEQWSIVAPLVQGAANNVSGGQFRILFTADDRLDGQETVFGTVTDGQDILEAEPDFRLCTALTQAVPGCATDLTNALIIESVTVEPE